MTSIINNSIENTRRNVILMDGTYAKCFKVHLTCLLFGDNLYIYRGTCEN